MITCVEEKIHFSNDRRITAISAKFMSEDEVLKNDPLVATIVAAIYKTTLLADQNGKGIKIDLDKKRSNVVDLKIILQSDKLTRSDIAKFFDALQKAVDETKLF